MRVTLCGSARFEEDFKYWNERLTLCGHVVYSLAVYPSDKGGKDWYNDVEKAVLDRVHKEKIENSDAIFVINKDNYIGESTKSEISFAQTNGKRVIYWFREFGGETACPYNGCFDPLINRPPCYLCYE